MKRTLQLVALLALCVGVANATTFREQELVPMGYRTEAGAVSLVTAEGNFASTACRVFLNVESTTATTTTITPTTTTTPPATTTTLGALIPRLDRLFAWLSPTSAWAANESLTVSIGTVVNGVDYVLGSFDAATSTGVDTITLAECPPSLYASWTVAGDSPMFTFEVWVARY